MKNAYIDQLLDRLADGEELTDPKLILTRAYQAPAYTRYGLICVNDALHGAEKAAALAQQLSMAGINELYITGEWGNQFEAWMALDSFGLKLRGICRIMNAEHYQDVDKWGGSSSPEGLESVVSVRGCCKYRIGVRKRWIFI